MKRSATFVLSLTIYLFAAAASHAQTASQSALVEGAKKEGKLIWYTSMAVDTSKPLLDAFLKDYPFIQAELVRLGEEQLMNRGFLARSAEANGLSMLCPGVPSRL